MNENLSKWTTAKGIDFGVIEWVKCGTFRWLGHKLRLNLNVYAKIDYLVKLKAEM